MPTQKTKSKNQVPSYLIAHLVGHELEVPPHGFVELDGLAPSLRVSPSRQPENHGGEGYLRESKGIESKFIEITRITVYLCQDRGHRGGYAETDTCEEPATSCFRFTGKTKSAATTSKTKYTGKRTDRQTDRHYCVV